MKTIPEAIARIMHESDRQLCEIYGIRDIDSWAMLSNERKKERITIVQMIQHRSEIPAISNNTELDECRSKLMKSIVLALSEESDSCIHPETDSAGTTTEGVEVFGELAEDTLPASERLDIKRGLKKGAKANGGL